MPLIVAIEPDASQAALIAALSPRHLDAEIVVTPSVDAALRIVDARVPDLLLTPPLLAARDDAALTARVRALDERGIEVPILVIPVLAPDEEAGAADGARPAGLLTRMRKPRKVARTSKGCAPAVFATQIQEYLARAAADRHDREESERQVASAHLATATAPLLAELLPLGTAVAVEARVEFPPETTADAYADFVVEEEPEPDAADDPPAAPFVPEVVPDAVPDVLLDTIPGFIPVPAEAAPIGSVLADAAPPVQERHSYVADVETFAPVEISVAETVGAADPVVGAADPVVGMADSAGAAADMLSLEQTVRLSDDGTLDEPDGVERADADELWTALPPLHVQTMSPIEGPSLRRTPLPKPPKVAKARPRRTREKTPASVPREKRSTPDQAASKPMQDEWGLYDPEQCGFAALLDRLEEITATAAPDRKRGKRSAIMRR